MAASHGPAGGQSLRSRSGLWSTPVAFLSALVLAGAGARADEFSVGVEDVDLYPIARVNAGQFDGFTRALLDRFATSLGHRFVYKPLPIRRLTQAHLAGEVDLIFPDEPHWQAGLKQGKALLYSGDIVTFHDVIMVKPHRLGQALKSVGIVRGFTAWKLKPEIDRGEIRQELAQSPDKLLRMVLMDRVDGANIALEVARYQLGQLGQPDALQADLKQLPLRASHYRASSLRHPELIRALSDFLIREADAIKTLRASYGLE